ncbi:MAG: glycosyltransferase [Candidatus Reddybacter sp.]
MDFTVIICTYNRCGNISMCIDALNAQKDTDGIEWEVLIVDNNSSDDTRNTVQKLTKNSSLSIRYAFEPKQGLNHARNRGIRESSGRFFAYIDDDITVSENWLKSLYQALSENDTDAAGGRIHLDPNITLPLWITINPEMYGFLGHQDYGDAALILDGKKRYPFGGNMAFCRRVPNRIGYFNTNLGRKGEGRKKGELFKGAETDYFHRINSTGNATIRYAPNAIVFHHILPHQLEKQYFLTIHKNAGYQKAYHDKQVYKRNLFGVPLFLIPQTVRAGLNYALETITKGSDASFRKRMTLSHFVGSIAGYINSGRKNG